MVTDLLTEYVHCIDSDDLERWPLFFTEEARYQITSELNHRNGFPIGVMAAGNRRMMEDRVAALRRANLYEAQTYRHLISAVRVISVEPDRVEAETNFLLVRTMHDGRQDLFASGRYLDRIATGDGTPVFESKLVLLDSDKIDTLLVIPI